MTGATSTTPAAAPAGATDVVDRLMETFSDSATMETFSESKYVWIMLETDGESNYYAISIQ